MTLTILKDCKEYIRRLSWRYSDDEAQREDLEQDAAEIACRLVRDHGGEKELEDLKRMFTRAYYNHLRDLCRTWWWYPTPGPTTPLTESVLEIYRDDIPMWRRVYLNERYREFRRILTALEAEVFEVYVDPPSELLEGVRRGGVPHYDLANVVSIAPATFSRVWDSVKRKWAMTAIGPAIKGALIDLEQVVAYVG